MSIYVDDIKSRAFRFEFNGIDVKVKIKILNDDNRVIFTIGLSNPNNVFKYENWFTKFADIDECGRADIVYKYIEHPPFRFYSKYIVMDGSLDKFFSAIFDKLKQSCSTDIEVEQRSVKVGTKEKRLQLYPETFVNKKISEQQKETIIARFPPDEARRIIAKCERDGMTVRFTDDIKKYKRLKLDDIE